jgi:hypothetical protein
MSIIRMLTRLTAVAALRGTTWADDRVFDSDNTPLSQALTLNAAAKPYIVVFTDTDNRNDMSGVELYGSRREMSLVLEIGVASKTKGETGKETLEIPQTDEGMELALDMVEDQALWSLLGDPQNEWAELLKHFIISVTRVSGQRGASADRDHRWAARQLAIICDVTSDVPPGTEISEDHPISQFAELAKRDPGALMEAAGEICEALASRRESPKWEQVQAQLGVRRHGLRAIGLAPLSSDLPIIASPHGDDLTDKRGEAPILRELGADDIDLTEEEVVGLIEPKTIRTNVATIKPSEKRDKVVIDGEGTE